MTGVTSRLALVALLTLWFGVVLALHNLGVFALDPRTPPIPMALSVLGPPMVFALLYRGWEWFRRAVLSLDLVLLTALQAWRIVGAMFLVLYNYDLLPGSFAWPAGVGDMIVGVYAPFVVVAIVRRTRRWRTHVVLLNVLGLLDFVGAIGGGMLSGGSSIGILTAPGELTTAIMQDLPLALIPTFFVPCWILLHIVSLLQLRRDAILSDAVVVAERPAGS